MRKRMLSRGSNSGREDENRKVSKAASLQDGLEKTDLLEEFDLEPDGNIPVKDLALDPEIERVSDGLSEGFSEAEDGETLDGWGAEEMVVDVGNLAAEQSLEASVEEPVKAAHSRPASRGVHSTSSFSQAKGMRLLPASDDVASKSNATTKLPQTHQTVLSTVLLICSFCLRKTSEVWVEQG
jgi:hypothetical protein